MSVFKQGDMVQNSRRVDYSFGIPMDKVNLMKIVEVEERKRSGTRVKVEILSMKVGWSSASLRWRYLNKRSGSPNKDMDYIKKGDIVTVITRALVHF